MGGLTIARTDAGPPDGPPESAACAAPCGASVTRLLSSARWAVPSSEVLMIIVSGRIYVRPERRDAFLAASIGSVTQARHTPGCLDFVVAADLSNPDASTSMSSGTLKPHSRPFAATGQAPISLRKSYVRTFRGITSRHQVRPRAVW